MTCEACRTIPPVVSEDYTPKGTFSNIAGLKFNTYVTGPSNAKTALLTIYDIFGMSSQTTQGADLLAARLNALVLIPDFFIGDGAKPEWFPTDTDEKKAALGAFFTQKAAFGENVKVLLESVQAYKGGFPSVEKWGAYGLCWGGKVLALSSGPETPFVATAQVHPGRMERADAEPIAIPHAILASKDEPAEEVKAYAEIIERKAVGGFVETYETMWHGWMGARANLQQESSLKEYTRGYTQLADFFDKYFAQVGGK
ncbi:hypothetical protein P175DRAFT_0498465 [Aspergillus ochraceoroseus IBT 24754]|uniref:Dienelactone hydrolase domain-containing protein n=1 Tax=Aspergillus ochraceoroseus IBT 24754 TaxID=1392256 RepID=A0A2T5M9X6_9EURO|nr:uncharacterized protein P175DRAFT_0498465 [Aspergillus ochraceoroseus IBT 24754]PTU25343.1 hypothetical protein P175DRAFT_0498465 [Aspergillus ochraceoroseus IBT 24754]